MHDKDYYKISIDPEIFNTEKQHTAFTTELFRDLSEILQREKGFVEIKQKYDYVKYQSLNINSNLDSNEQVKIVDFLAEDESEVSRGLTYQITDDKPEKKISIDFLRQKLCALGIINKDIQDFVLQIILQNRQSIHFGLLSIIPFISMQLSGMTHQVIAIFNEQTKLRVTYEQKTKLVKISVFGPVFDGKKTKYKDGLFNDDKTKPVILGEAELKLSINQEKDVKLESLSLLLKPVSTLRTELKERAADLKKAELQITTIFTNLENKYEIKTDLPVAKSTLMPQSIQPSTNKPRKKPNRHKTIEFIENHSGKLLLLSLGICSFVLGVVLCATGVASPAGIFLTTLGIKATLSSPLLIVSSGVLTSTATSIAFMVAAGVKKGFQALVNRISQRNDNTRNQTTENVAEIPLKVNKKSTTYNYTASRIVSSLKSQNNMTKVREYFLQADGKVCLRVYDYHPRPEQAPMKISEKKKMTDQEHLSQLIFHFNLSGRAFKDIKAKDIKPEPREEQNRIPQFSSRLMDVN